MKQSTKLLLSLIFGWTVVGSFLLSILVSYVMDDIYYAPMFYIAAILLSLRYSMMRPILAAGSVGFTVAGITYVIERFFRRDHSISIGLLIGMLFFIVLILIKNFFVSIYLLIRETIFYISLKNENQHHVNHANHAVAATGEMIDVSAVSAEQDGLPLIQQKIFDQGVSEFVTEEHMAEYYDHIGFAKIANEYYRPENNTYFMWNWYGRSSEDPFKSNNKLMMIGGKEKQRDLFIENFCTTKFAADDLSVFRIFSTDQEVMGEEQWLGGILRDIELIPGSELVTEQSIAQNPEFREFKDVTLESRKFFADTYFHLLAEAKGVSYDQLFPSGVHYDPETSSPLAGYVEAIERSPYQEALIAELQDFGAKPWVKTPSGFVRPIPDHLPVPDKVLLWFETIWEMYMIPGYFGSWHHPHHFVFHIDIPNEVLPTPSHHEAFREAMKYLVYRSEWKNYDMSILATIDEPNHFLTLPFNQHVLFSKDHVSRYKEATNITISPQQSLVLTSVDPGTCVWVDHTQDLALSLKLLLDERIDFVKNEA